MNVVSLKFTFQSNVHKQAYCETITKKKKKINYIANQIKLKCFAKSERERVEIFFSVET